MRPIPRNRTLDRDLIGIEGVTISISLCVPNTKLQSDKKQGFHLFGNTTQVLYKRPNFCMRSSNNAKN
jgi:hypothetical protein